MQYSYRKRGVRVLPYLGSEAEYNRMLKAKELLVLLQSDMNLIFVDEYIINET